MKTLYLVRHASASLDSPSRKDIDRLLNYDGVSEAEKMARYLRKQNARFDMIITSAANRAYQTAQIFAKHFFFPIPEIKKDEIVFLNNPEKNLAILSSADNSFQNILFVGHNPSITQLANELSGTPVSSFKPAGIACIIFEIENWDLLPQKGVLEFYADPLLVS